MQEPRKTLTFSYIDHLKELEIETALAEYLQLIKKSKLFSNLSYIIKEMAGNANKANLKRVYFTMKGLDIRSNLHYDQGIKTFKDDVFQNPQIYQLESAKKQCRVDVNIFTEKDALVLQVTNNSEILPVEKERITDRLNKAKRFESMEDALKEGLDSTEGAGFGIILMVLMLRKMGLTEEVFNVEGGAGKTDVRIMIPLNLLDKEQEEMIADIIKKEINEIPQFPEHVLQIQKVLADPNANFDDVTKVVNKDTSMIADLLKVANSSLYMLPNKVKTIREAISFIGFKGVKSLFLTYSAQQMLKKNYRLDLIKDTIEHCTETAFFAYELAKHYRAKEALDEIYTAAMLHDFGRIIIDSLNPNVMDKVIRLCNAKGIDTNIVENLSDGFNHSLIGAKLAEKWNFSEEMVEAIKYHHNPLEASENNKFLVYLVYLANIIYYYHRKEYQFEKISYQVLKFLSLSEKKAFDLLVEKITSLLQSRKQQAKA